MIKGYLKLVVLKELMQYRLTGYEIMQKLKEVAGKKPSSGTIYPMLRELHEKGYISQKDEGEKKFYRITAKGKKLVEKMISEREEIMVRRAALLDSVREMLNEKEKKALIALEKEHKAGADKMEFVMLKHIMPLKGSIMNAMSLGSAKARKEVLRILDDARDKIDKVAAEGDNK